MKKRLLQSLSWFVLLGFLLAPTACKNTLDFQLNTIRPVPLPVSKAAVTVTGPVELNGRLFVIDSAATSDIVSFTGDKLVLKSAIPLRSARVNGTAALNNIATGDFIAAGVSEKTPRGLLKKVTGKTSGSVNGEVGLTVQDATFEGIFKKISFEIEGSASASIKLERSLEGELKSGIVTGTGKASLKGGYEAKAAVAVKVEIDEAILQYASTTVSLERSVELGLSAEAAIKLSGEPELLRKALPPLEGTILIPTPFGIPLPLPVVITPDFVVKLKLAAGMEGSFEMTPLKLTDKFTYGVEYKRATGFGLIKKEEPLHNEPTFTAKGGGFVEIGLNPELEFSFYDIKLFTFGLGAELSGKLEATCSLEATNADLKHELEIKLSAGLKGNLFARWNSLSETLKPETEKERTVESSVTFAIAIKKEKSTFCGADSEPDPIQNNTTYTSSALSTGDPHLRTFDSYRYDMMAVGEFVAVRSTAPADQFEVQVRQEPQTNSTVVSLNTGVAIRTGSGNEVLCIYPDRVYINGDNKGLSFSEITLSGGSILQRNAAGVVLETPTGDHINVRFFGKTLDFDMQLAPSRKGKVKGIFGNFDDVVTNDVVRGDNGQPVPNTFAGLYPTYADSWRIQQSQSLFVYDAATDTNTYTDRNFPRSAATLTDQQRAAAKSICEQAGVTDPAILENCILDVALTNDRTYADRALAFQAATTALNSFAIGQFSSSDVQLDYIGAGIVNRSVVLDTRAKDFAAVIMRQGVNIQRGFVSEFNFSTAELDPSSCFFLALWPTDTKTRSVNQKRMGFCFGTENGNRIVFVNYALNATSGTVLGKSIVPNFVDGRIHKVRISERNLINGKWRLEVYLDNMSQPVCSVDNDNSIAESIDCYNRTGFIEFQINQGVPSSVRLFNWQYNAF